MVVILLAAFIAIMVIPVATFAAVRAVTQVVGQSGLSRARDDSDLNVRLTRIEEAIDAMAGQIERLSEQQRALLERRD